MSAQVRGMGGLDVLVNNGVRFAPYAPNAHAQAQASRLHRVAKQAAEHRGC